MIDTIVGFLHAGKVHSCKGKVHNLHLYPGGQVQEVQGVIPLQGKYIEASTIYINILPVKGKVHAKFFT